MDRLEKLEAIEAIKTLKARYFRMIDTRNLAELRACFAPDLIADFRMVTGTLDNSGLTHGVEAYIDKVAPILDEVTIVHHGHMAEIQILSTNAATGIWAMEDKTWSRSGSSLPFAMIHGYGHDHEHYVRLNGDWRISEIKLTRLRVDIQSN